MGEAGAEHGVRAAEKITLSVANGEQATNRLVRIGAYLAIVVYV